MKRFLLFFPCLLLSVGLFAQVGELQGKVTDADTGEELPFANVAVAGTTTGTSTDFNGYYSIKPLGAGTYDIQVSFLGYQTALVKDVVIEADKIVYLDFELSEDSKVLAEIVVKEYKVPLIKPDETSTGATVTKEDIDNLPTREVNSIASTAAGVYQSDEGGALNIKGARSDATDYYIDGVKVRGSSALPAASIEQMSVVTGGLPAKYGDVTGGIVNITTRGPSKVYFGSVEYVTSQLFDAYNYNLVSATISGPLVKKNKGELNERAVLGFIVSGEYRYEKDDDPSALGIYRASDSALQSIIDSPLSPSESSTGLIPNINYITASDLEKHKARENVKKNEINITGNIEFQPIQALSFKIGGTFNYRNGGFFGFGDAYKNFVRRYEPFNSEHIPSYSSQTYRVFGRITQRFGSSALDKKEEGKKESFLQNAYYSLQFDFTKFKDLGQDPVHKDNLFDYGHVGEFTTHRAPVYTQEQITLPGEDGRDLTIDARVFQGYADTLVTFQGGTANPIAAQHNNQYFDLAGDDPQFQTSIFDIINNNGLLNGGRTVPISSVYSMYYLPGVVYPLYYKDENDQYRLTFNGSVDIKKPGAPDRNKHSLEFGFEYEQRIDRSYSINAENLWDRMRLLVSRPGLDIERDIDNPILLIDGQEIPVGQYDPNGGLVFGAYDTVLYNFVRPVDANGDLVGSYFDQQLRDRLGYSSTDFVDIDAISPQDLSLDMFSPEDLFADGNSLVTYSGYDYLGNKLSKQPAFEDFFARDENGNLVGAIGAFRPVYAAGYIQDKFTFKNDLIFNIGVRIDRFDANQKVLKDQYSLYGVRTAAEVEKINNIDISHPSTIGEDFVVYVDDPVNPTTVKGYRDGDDWYNAQGTLLTDPGVLEEAGSVNPYLSNPLSANPRDDIKNENFDPSTAFEDYTPQITVMPRVAFSFPISDEAIFFAHYNVLSQRPQSRISTTASQYYFFLENIGGTLSNPNLKPEKTVDYQLGFKQKLSSSSAISISAFYKELRDMIQVVNIPFAYPDTYNTYGNVDFGTVKGFEISYDLRRTNNIRMLANYTLQFADGTGSGDRSQAGLVNSGQPNLRVVRPLSYDARHTLNLSIDYRFKSGSKYNGPKIGKVDILANTGANIILRARSGTPYTAQKNETPEAQFGIANRANLDGDINGSQLPWNFNMDLKIDKDFVVGKGKKHPLNFNVYLQINNVFNTRNIINVYRFTGSPEDDGYLSSAVGQQTVDSQINPESFVDLYNIRVNNPNNYSLPRRIRLGASFSF